MCFYKMILSVLILVCFLGCNAQITEIKTSTKELLRPTLEQLLGKIRTNKLLGVPKDLDIKLPEIPKINRDAKAVSVYDPRKEESKTVQLKSEEEEKYNFLFLRELFLATRRVEPDASEINNWMNVLSQGGGREGVYRALVLDEIYAGLENFDRPINGTVQDFISYYTERFLSQSIKDETLKKMNFYTLKRVIVERTLEVVDELQKDRETFLNWYAVFSGEIAAKFPNVWQNHLRSNPEKIEHKKWAMSVPMQHVKSEIILKLHGILNKLQNI